MPYGNLDDWAVKIASQNIKIISDKEESATTEFQKAHELLKEADRIFFLGFGYHEANMERLQIRTLPIHPVLMYGTSYCLSITTMNYVRFLRCLGSTFEKKIQLIEGTAYKFLYNEVDLAR